MFACLVMRGQGWPLSKLVPSHAGDVQTSRLSMKGLTVSREMDALAVFA